MWPKILGAKESWNKITKTQGQKISIKIQYKLEVPVGNCGAKPNQVKRQGSQNNKEANLSVWREIEDPWEPQRSTETNNKSKVLKAMGAQF